MTQQYQYSTKLSSQLGACRNLGFIDLLIIFLHRYLDSNKLTKVTSDAFSELANLKYLRVNF